MFLFDYPDERETAERPDVLVFTGPEAAEPIDFAGPVGLALTIATDAPIVGVFAKLMDVDETGAAHMIVRGQTETRSEDGSREINIDLGHTGYRLLAGHRLRLHLASSDYPLFFPSTGTDEDPWSATEFARATQTLTVDRDSQARLALTVLQT